MSITPKIMSGMPITAPIRVRLSAMPAMMINNPMIAAATRPIRPTIARNSRQIATNGAARQHPEWFEAVNFFLR